MSQPDTLSRIERMAAEFHRLAVEKPVEVRGIEYINMLDDLMEGARKRRYRHPGDFDVWPTDEQMEYFKRGGR